MARKQINKKDNLVDKDIETDLPKGTLKSMWQSASGEWLKSYKFDSEEHNDSFNIEQCIKNALSDITPSNRTFKYTKSKYNLNIYLSDQHIGASVSYGLYENTFTAEEYNKRMDSIEYYIFNLVALYGRFNKINILFLGDTFDGEDGFTVKRTHKLPQNMTNEECFATGLKTNAAFLSNIIDGDIANQYCVYFVRESNHDGSFDYYLFKSLQFWLNNKYPYPLVSATIADKFIGYFSNGLHTFMYTHGKDNVDMKNGLPLNIDTKTELFINQYIEYNNLKGTLHFIKGDLHQNNTNNCKTFRYKNVPSLFGSSKWIMANYGNTKPSCAYDVFCEYADELVEGCINL